MKNNLKLVLKTEISKQDKKVKNAIACKIKTQDAESALSDTK